MNREILKIALPNIISNITVPLMGIFSTAIAGHCGDSAHTIGSLAIGVSIFNFIYWNCSFVRMGTSGLTAQAYGAGDDATCTKMLVRAIAVALLLGVLVIVLQYPLGEAAIWAMNGDNLVSDYFYTRVWAVPAGIILFGFNGWFTGMQNAVIPMAISILVNTVHILCSLWFAFGYNMGIVGIAYGSVVAQWLGVTVAVGAVLIFYRRHLTHIVWSEVLDRKQLHEFFNINRDIIIRTVCLVGVYTFFTAASARMDNPVTLAVNTILLELFTLFSYMNDGFAYAAEALTGRFIGARDVQSLRRCIRLCVWWALGTAVLFIGIYLGWWRQMLQLFLPAGSPDGAAIFALAGEYIVWIIVIPLAAALPFLMDGIMVGATESKVMRDSMILATAAYFGIYYGLEHFIGNNALWLAFSLYMFLRGVLQIIMSHRLRSVYAKASR